MNKSNGQEFCRCNKEIDETWKEMRKFYNFEKCDNDFLSDAVIFTKAETLTQSSNASQIVVSTPGQR